MYEEEIYIALYNMHKFITWRKTPSKYLVCRMTLDMCFAFIPGFCKLYTSIPSGVNFRCTVMCLGLHSFNRRKSNVLNEGTGKYSPNYNNVAMWKNH